MNKTAQPYLDKILESIQRIEEYLEDRNKDEFITDYLLQDAIIRRLEIIGEATQKLEDDFKQNYPQIPWKKMAG